MTIRGSLTLVLLFLWTATVSCPAVAIQLPPPLPTDVMAPVQPSEAGWVRSAWSARDGAPPSLANVVSSSDGIVLGASLGKLHRFDGARFSEVEGLDGAPFRVDTTMTSRPGDNGDVWFGTFRGEVIRVGRTSVDYFGATEGLPLNTEIRDIAVQDGRVLAATSRGLYQLRRRHWQSVELAQADGRPVWGAVFDGSRWWAVVESRLVTISRDLRTLTPIADVSADMHAGLVGDARVGVWYWQLSGDRNLCRLGRSIVCYEAKGITYPRIDRDGVIWWARPQGLMGFSAGLPTSRDPTHRRGQIRVIDVGVETSGLTAASDGTLWINASGRLMRLARTPVERIPSPSGATVSASNGNVWLAAFSEGLHLIGRPPPSSALFVDAKGHVGTVLPAADPSSSRRLSNAETAAESRPVILAEAKGVPASIVHVERVIGANTYLATLTPPGLWKYEDGGWKRHSSLPLDKGAVVRGIAQDSTGTLYAGAQRDHNGLYAFNGKDWQPVAWRDDGAGEAEPIFRLYGDAQDRIWIGHRSSITMLFRGKARTYNAAHGLSVGPIRDIAEFDGDLWVVGNDGVARFHHNAFETLRLNHEVPIGGISGLAIDDGGAIWLGAAQGIVRVAHDQWSSAIGRDDLEARVTLLGEQRGVEYPISDLAPRPAVAKAGDGSLWFLTRGATYRIDPRRVGPAQPAPALVIDAVVADGVRQKSSRRLSVPAGSHRLAVTFRTLGPVIPDRTTFRYRIAGLDNGWIPVSGRDVVLDRLPPGNYTLELQASREDGMWTGTPVTLAISLPPTFWQSIWAKVLIAALLCAVTALVIVVRMKQVEGRRRTISEAQIRERGDIARDLHDTLLQGIHGLILRVQACTFRLPEDSEVRTKLDQALDTAESLLIEGRDRVMKLRTRLPSGDAFPDALEQLGLRLSRDHGVVFQQRVYGVGSIPDYAQDETFQIVREALLNAFQHAKASQVSLEIDYRVEHVRVSVVDDGQGIDPLIMGNRMASGHWGITGIRERATRLGANLGIEGAAGKGTRVTLDLPMRPKSARSRGKSLLMSVRHRMFSRRGHVALSRDIRDR